MTATATMKRLPKDTTMFQRSFLQHVRREVEQSIPVRGAVKVITAAKRERSVTPMKRIPLLRPVARADIPSIPVQGAEVLTRTTKHSRSVITM